MRLLGILLFLVLATVNVAGRHNSKQRARLEKLLDRRAIVVDTTTDSYGESFDDSITDSDNDGTSGGYDGSYDDSYGDSHDGSYDGSYDNSYDNSYDDSYDEGSSTTDEIDWEEETTTETPTVQTTTPPRPENNTLPPKPTGTASPGNEFSKCDGSSHGRMTSAKRIMNGRQAKKGSFPYLAIITSRDESGEYVFCGGSIVNERWIISAAHCVYEDLDNSKSDEDKQAFMKSLWVIVGEHDLQKDSSEEMAHKVVKVFQHRNYDHDGYTGNDMLLLKLKTPIQFTRPVCIPDAKDNFKAGDTCFVAGFGDGNKPENILNQAVGRIISDEQCESEFDIDKVSGHEKQFCTLGVRGTSCQGDSGGPVVCWDRKDSRWELAGLVSYGTEGCGLKDGVNQRVSHFRAWIETTIKEN